MFATITRVGVLAFVCFALAGCPALWVLNVRNGGNEEIIVTMEAPDVPLSASDRRRIDERFAKKAMPGQLVEIPIMQVSTLARLEKQELVVRTVQSGQVIARRSIESLWKDPNAGDPDYPNVYIIVTKDRIEAAANQHPNRR